MVELIYCVVLVSSRALQHLVWSSALQHLMWSSFSIAWCSSAHALFRTLCCRASILRGARQLTRSSTTPGVVELLFCVVLVSSRTLPHLVWSSLSIAWCSSAHALFHTWCGRGHLLRGARQLTCSSTPGVVGLLYCVVLISSRTLPQLVWSRFSSA